MVSVALVCSEQPGKMALPVDAVMSDVLLSAITELKDFPLPHIKKLNDLLVEAFTSLNTLLSKKTCESWLTEEEKSAFKELQDALQKTVR
jgi:hypothetical protein